VLHKSRQNAIKI